MGYLITSILAYILYIDYSICVFYFLGIPESYSNTFYLFNEKKYGLGFLFPIVSAIYTFLLIPSWFHISDQITPSVTFLAFFSGAGLLFVAASPFFKECARDTGNKLADLIYKSFHGQGLVHTMGALFAMIASVIWISLSPYWYFILIWLFVAIIAGICTKTLLKSVIFWIEFVIYNMMASFIVFYNILLFFL